MRQRVTQRPLLHGTLTIPSYAGIIQHPTPSYDEQNETNISSSRNNSSRSNSSNSSSNSSNNPPSTAPNPQRRHHAIDRARRRAAPSDVVWASRNHMLYLHVHRHVGHALAAIHQHLRADGVSSLGNFFHGIDPTQGVRGVNLLSRHEEREQEEQVCGLRP